MASEPWIPILEEADRHRALLALDELVEALAGLPIETDGPCDLARGLAGRGLALAYLAQSARYQHVRAAAMACMDGAITGLAQGVHSPSLFAGVAGVAWAAQHLLAAFPALAEDGGGEDAIDAFLLDCLDQQPWRGDYDLVSGLVGIGLYAWDALPRRSAAELLTRTIHHLEHLARSMDQGVAWHTAPSLLPEWQRQRDPQGYFNLGVAHGNPAVINLLARAAASGIQPRTCQHLAREGSRWLASTRFPAEAPSCFGSLVGGDGNPDQARGGRIAWCYGDLGIAITQLGAARWLRDGDMETEALGVAHVVAQKAAAGCHANDAGFCHGAAGNGHLFNRLYQATGDPAFLAAARAWLRTALDQRRPGEGIGGYQAWLRPDHPQGPWMDEPGLLEGSAGIALALLSATEPIPSGWDRMMLADLPPRLGR
jgi:lantibiotic modifying enzyme